MVQPQQLAKVAHGQSLGGHLVSLGKGARLPVQGQTASEQRRPIRLPGRSRSPESMNTIDRKSRSRCTGNDDNLGLEIASTFSRNAQDGRAADAEALGNGLV